MPPKDNQDIVVSDLSNTQDIENRPAKETTNIRDLDGFVEVVNAVPTYIPKTFKESIVIYSGTLYVFNFITNSWVSGGGLKDAGKGTSLPTASSNTDSFYYKSDTDTLYRSNGTAWIALN